MSNIIRLYTGKDGQTHIEELDLATHPELTSLQNTKGIVFRTTKPGHFSDWHNAPRRQFVITLAGEVEIGLADGTKHRYGPGHVTLAEDLTGKGHTTRVVGDQPRLSVTIPLAD
jgi:quercetin dioxygenase-like cupin family protein